MYLLYIRLLDSRTHNFSLNPAIWQTITKKTPGGGGLGTHQIFNLQGSVAKFSHRAEMKYNIFILKMTRIYLLVFGLWFRGKLGNIDTIVIPHLGRRHALYYRLNKKKSWSDLCNRHIVRVGRWYGTLGAVLACA